MRWSVFLLLCSLAGVIGGAFLIGRWAVGAAIIFDSLAVGGFVLFRDDSMPGPSPQEESVPTLRSILAREAARP